MWIQFFSAVKSAAISLSRTPDPSDWATSQRGLESRLKEGGAILNLGLVISCLMACTKIYAFGISENQVPVLLDGWAASDVHCRPYLRVL